MRGCPEIGGREQKKNFKFNELTNALFSVLLISKPRTPSKASYFSPSPPLH